jgi:hypothetical protein
MKQKKNQNKNFFADIRKCAIDCERVLQEERKTAAEAFQMMTDYGSAMGS